MSNVGIQGAGLIPIACQALIQGDWRNFLLRADFLVDAAAPLPSPYQGEVGTLTITDTNNKLSVVSGKLSFATGGVGSGNPGAWAEQLSRVVGRAVVSTVTPTAGGNAIEIGWDTGVTGNLADCIRVGGSVTITRDNTGTISTETLVNSTTYQVAILLRTTGYFAFIKGGAFTSWTLVWVGVSSSGSMFPGISGSSNAVTGTVDNFRVLDLPTPFNSDYGLATQRLAGAQGNAVGFTHEANCIIECVMDAYGGTGRGGFIFRKQDASNYWECSWDKNTSFQLREIVAGAPTTRATAAFTPVNGERVVVVADGSTIRGYHNNVLRWTYSSASNFATATAGETFVSGGFTTVSNVVSWPRTLSAQAAALLDAAVA